MLNRDLVNLLQEKAVQLRYDVLETIRKGATGRISSSFSCAEILTSLFYGGEYRFNPKNPSWEDRDRFLLSKGQASPIFYVMLADLGFFPKEDLDYICKEGGKMGSLIQHDVPGAEINSASLGAGLGIGCGMAIAGKLNKKNYSVFVLMGDGECYEGSIWESAMLAGSYNLNNLIVIIDQNHMCCTDFIEDCVKQYSLKEKFLSFGFDVKEVNGHSVEELMGVFSNFRCRKSSRPLAVIADTVKAKGIKSVENTILCHEYCPRIEQIDAVIDELNQWSGRQKRNDNA